MQLTASRGRTQAFLHVHILVGEELSVSAGVSLSLIRTEWEAEEPREGLGERSWRCGDKAGSVSVKEATAMQGALEIGWQEKTKVPWVAVSPAPTVPAVSAARWSHWVSRCGIQTKGMRPTFGSVPTTVGTGDRCGHRPRAGCELEECWCLEPPGAQRVPVPWGIRQLQSFPSSVEGKGGAMTQVSRTGRPQLALGLSHTSVKKYPVMFTCYSHE